MEFHFRSGASLHLQRFTVASRVDQLVWSGILAGLFVNGTDVTSWCCPVTRRLSGLRSGEGAAYFCPRVTECICYPRSVFRLSTYDGAGAHLSAL